MMNQEGKREVQGSAQRAGGKKLEMVTSNSGETAPEESKNIKLGEGVKSNPLQIFKR